jgi:hypothetical protein
MDDEKSNWTIKNMPVAVRKAALDGATRANENVPTWLARAVEKQASMERGAVVFPPGQPVANHTDEPERLAYREPELAHRGQLDFAGLAQAMQASIAGYTAAGIDMPKPFAREFGSLVRNQVRVTLGLPPVKRRPRKDVALIEG